MGLEVEIVSETEAITVSDKITAVIQTVELSVQPSTQVVEILTGTQGPAGTPGSRSIAADIVSAPVGDVSSNDVQSAIAELSAEKAPRSLIQSFTQADLSIANILAITHDFGIYPSSVVIWDSTFEQIQPDDVAYINANSLSVSLSSFAPIVGIYTIAIGA